VLESVTDGALEVHRGAAEIRAAWTAYLEVLGRGDFRLRKQFLSAGEEWINNGSATACSSGAVPT
jgi:hypothetical protein